MILIIFIQLPVIAQQHAKNAVMCFHSKILRERATMLCCMYIHHLSFHIFRRCQYVVKSRAKANYQDVKVVFMKD